MSEMNPATNQEVAGQDVSPAAPPSVPLSAPPPPETLGYVPAPGQPPAPDAPVKPRQRVIAIDALRGVAILGILLLNVRSFSMPADAYLYPEVIPQSQASLWVFGVVNVVAMGKFLTIFATLYGVGILLSTRRNDELGRGSFGMFAKRSVVLGVVGILHMTLIWYGDILFLYAAMGLIAFTMRNWKPFWQVFAATIAFLGVFLLLIASGIFMIWAVSTGKMQPIEFTNGGPDAWAAAIETYQSGYIAALQDRVPSAIIFQTIMFFFFGPQVLGLMLCGMALFKGGFFTGEWSARRYVVAGIIALLLGLGATTAVQASIARAGWPIHWIQGWGFAVTGLLQIVTAFGIASLLIGQFVYGKTPGLTRGIAAVGRMAFTNYLVQSLVGLSVFVLLGQFGKWSYLQQLGLVAAVWAVQIPLSIWWLGRFRYGPLEWLWRGATYGQLPKLKRDLPNADAPVASGHA